MIIPNITGPYTLDLMGQIEGPDWLAQQGRDASFTFDHALTVWRREVDRALDVAQEDDEHLAWFLLHPPEHTRAVVYGEGGWTRYFVRFNGEIVFSVSHGSAHPKKRARAEGLGFRVE